VDFITGQGYLDGPGGREKAGLGYGGPCRVITNLGVFGFEEESKRMMLESIHPGVSIEQIQENTSFELIIPAKIPETAPPTQKELDVIRSVDPQKVRELEFR